ncbi:hypothetical protein HOLleu_13408 [Holothuria leucospilota]|uniref:Uncharacterized protein n=1 Tax=Holothuria leucospilota TaxID=206669 RepID=A0A9Q1HDP3_HOLLE|nr:hypothetical protein HOLleu_13408 [Holothuria leucospilota]
MSKICKTRNFRQWPSEALRGATAPCPPSYVTAVTIGICIAPEVQDYDCPSNTHMLVGTHPLQPRVLCTSAGASRRHSEWGVKFC